MTLTVHPAERTDLLADGLGELLATPLDDPFAEEIVVVPAKGVERWLTQRLSHRLGTSSSGGDGVCAGVRFLNPALAGLDAARPGPRRPVGPRPAGLAAARRSSTTASASRWCATLADPPRPRPRRRRRRCCGATAATRSRAGWPASSPATPRSGPHWSTDWREGRDTDGAGGDLDADLLWQPELWRRLVDRVDAPAPDVRHAETLARLRAGGDGLDLPAAAVAVRPHPAPGHRGRAAGRARASAATCTSGCRSRRPRCGTSSPGSAASVPPRGRRLRPTGATTRCSPRWAATRGSCSGRWPRSRQGRRQRARARRSDAAATRCWGGCRPTCAPTPRPTPPTRAARVLDAGGPVRAGARLPRSDPPGRRAARGPGRPARGRPDARAARHPRDVPRHRDLRAADLGRASVSPTCVDDGGPPGPPAPGAAGRPGAHQHQPAARRRGHPGRARRRSGHRDRGARPRAAPTRARAGSASTTTTWPSSPAGWSEAGDPVGPRRRRSALDFGMTASSTTPGASGLDRILLGVAMSGDDHRHVGRGAAARRRRQQRHRPRRPVGRATSTGSSAASTRWRGAPRRRRVGDRPAATASTQLTDVPRDDAWQLPQFDRELARAVESAGGRGRRRRSGWPTSAHLLASPARRPADPGQLPHRHAHRLHDGADAVGARTGWCACSAWTTGCSRAIASVDGDDVLARRPMTGERDVRSEDRQLLLDAILAAARDPRRHLHRRQRAHGRRPGRPPCRSASCSTPSTAPLATRRSATRCSSGTRCSRSTPATSCRVRSSASGRSASTAAPSPVPGPRPPPAGPGPPFLPSRCRRAHPRGRRRSPTCKAFFAHPVRAFLRAPARRHRAARGRGGRATPSRSTSTGSRSGGSATGCCASVLAGTRPERGDDGRAAARHAATRTARRPAPCRRSCDESQKLYRAHRPAAGRRAARTVDVDVDLGDGRRLTGTVVRSTAAGSSRSATPASARSTASAPGSTCSR